MEPTQRELLEALIARFEPRIRDLFLAAIADIKNNTHITSLTRHIENGDVRRAFETLNISPAVFNGINNSIAELYEQGGLLTVDGFPKWMTDPSSGSRVIFRFDVRNPAAENFLREHSASLVTSVTDDQLTIVRETLERGLTNGTNPRVTALDLVGRVDNRTGVRTGGTIGLTARQAGWVQNVRNDLQTLDRGYFRRDLRDPRFDAVVRRAIDSGTPLGRDEIDNLVTRYENRALRFRAETLSRNETIATFNRAEFDTLQQTVELGHARAQDITRIWDTASDERVRNSHMQMDGQEVTGLTQPFLTPTGSLLMHPGDTTLGAAAAEVIQCRCRVRTRIDFLAQVQAP